MNNEIKSGDWAESLVAEKLNELPAEFTVIRNIDIADRGRNSDVGHEKWTSRIG